MERVPFSTKTHTLLTILKQRRQGLIPCSIVDGKSHLFPTRKIPACLVELIIMTRHIARIFWGINRGGGTVLFLQWNIVIIPAAYKYKKLVECLLVTACCMASNPDIPLKSYMGDISKGVTNAHSPVNKYTKNEEKNKNCIRYTWAVMLQEKMLTCFY